jgi:glutamate racemase
MKIGVFDSGIGGKSVANAIEAALPDAEVLFRNDRQHVPYGTKPKEEILGYVLPIFAELEHEQVDCIVVACNTVSTNLIDTLRDRFSVPLIAVEPLVQQAAGITKSGIITVCATPATLTSKRYAELKSQFAKKVAVIEPDCSDWAYLIEQNQINEDIIRACVEPGINLGSDVIVLGCTHYHWIEREIQAIADIRAKVVQPEQLIIAQLRAMLPQAS